MTIKTKMLAFPLITALTILSVAGVAHRSFLKLDQTMQGMHRDLTSAREISTAMENLMDLHASAYKIVNWSALDYSPIKIEGLAKQIADRAGQLSALLENRAKSSEDPAEREAYGKIITPFLKYREWVDKTVGMASADSATASMMLGSVEEQFSTASVEMQRWQEHTAERSNEAYRLARENYRKNLTIFLIIVLAGFVVSLAAAPVVILNIVRTIKRIIDGLTTSSEHVASASSQYSAASQQLSNGASEQAASLEETSSSLEQMASMTRQNAESASQSNLIMKEVNQVVDMASGSMGELTGSMAEVFSASQETQNQRQHPSPPE